MVTISSHIFINIVQTVHFSSVKFTSGNEKSMRFLLISKFQNIWNVCSKNSSPIFYCFTFLSMLLSLYTPIQSSHALLLCPGSKTALGIHNPFLLNAKHKIQQTYYSKQSRINCTSPISRTNITVTRSIVGLIQWTISGLGLWPTGTVL